MVYPAGSFKLFFILFIYLLSKSDQPFSVGPVTDVDH